MPREVLMLALTISPYFIVFSASVFAHAGRPGGLIESSMGDVEHPDASQIRHSLNAPFAHEKASKVDFFVSGKQIPLLNTTVQDSYTGLLPITGNASDETRKLFFWYWPTSAPNGSNTLAIWLNGGPGCSSLIGFLSEHGAFTFRPGTEAPSVNPYAWSTVTLG
ncbi:alpha/beta-hydrolase [Auricularia subglabra TFB-10046 SS5]|nr:alpha/beta-hydrolase [Auricularia subglabra TFB-10046 SS5]